MVGEELLLDFGAVAVCGEVEVVGPVAAGMDVEVVDAHTAVGVSTRKPAKGFEAGNEVSEINESGG